MMMDEMVYMNEVVKKEDPLTHLSHEAINRNKLIMELQAASRYIEENEVIHVKTKKDIPTVIEYQGRRYILDHADHRK